jgi:hypothetical protein
MMSLFCPCPSLAGATHNFLCVPFCATDYLTGYKSKAQNITIDSKPLARKLIYVQSPVTISFSSRHPIYGKHNDGIGKAFLGGKATHSANITALRA